MGIGDASKRIARHSEMEREKNILETKNKHLEKKRQAVGDNFSLSPSLILRLG